jgi:hypothetical protein
MPCPPLPEFFGRLTTVRHQHEHLGETLKRLEMMCDMIEIGQSPTPEDLNPAQLLTALGDDLAQHFKAEESDAHFGAIALEEPRLLPSIVDLKADHGAMLAGIEGLSLTAGNVARWPELVVPTRHLIKTLRLHERAEALLLQEYFAPSESSAGASPLRSQLSSSQPQASSNPVSSK